jgi:hypothetical protein
MVFDKTTWKNKIHDGISELNNIGSKYTYAILLSTALWPIVESFRSGELSSLALLGATVGSNLLANIIQDWKDRNDGIKVLADQLISEPQIQKEAKELFDQLDIESILKCSLSDKVWKSVEGELSSELNNFVYKPSFINNISIVSGDVLNNIKYSTINKFSNVENVFITNNNDNNHIGNTSRVNYFYHLRNLCEALPLAALGADDKSDNEFTLDDIYIELDTQSILTSTQINTLIQEFKRHLSVEYKIKPEDFELVINDQLLRMRYENQEEMKQKYLDFSITIHKAGNNLSAHWATILSKKSVILGGPGTGKSSFVKKLIAWIAASKIYDNTRPPFGYSEYLLPIYIPLREIKIINNHETNALSHESRRLYLSKQILDYIVIKLDTFHATEFKSEINESIKNGECFIVFDGLDEVPQSSRALIREAVLAFLQEYPIEKVIITCRQRSYVGSSTFSGFDQYILKPFDNKQIEAFSTAWYMKLHSLQIIDSSQLRIRAIDLTKNALSNDLRTLAENPMLLTTLAIIHQKEISLPKDRVRLYNMAVEVLLNRWQKDKQINGDDVLPETLYAYIGNTNKLRDTIEMLAYNSHQAKSEGNQYEIARGKALELLESSRYIGDVKLAEIFLDYIDQRAGIIVGFGGEFTKPSTYGFPHKTFLEYLAGCYIFNQNIYYERDFIDNLHNLVPVADDWSLAITLGMENLAYNRETKSLLSLAYSLCKKNKLWTHKEIISTIWAGEIIRIIGIDEVKSDRSYGQSGKSFLSLVANKLKTVIQEKDNKLTAVSRIQSGDLLNIFPDPRFDKKIYFLPKSSTNGFICLNCGNAYKSKEYTKNTNNVYMSKYPVTVLQYKMYLTSTGSNISEEEKYNICSFENHPATFVSWLDSINYCEWLSQNIIINLNDYFVKDLLLNNWILTIPSIDEYRLAYTHNHAYGNNFTYNSRELNYNNSTPVGVLTGNIDEQYIYDLKGNVWEWTRDIYIKNHNQELVTSFKTVDIDKTAGYVVGGSYNSYNRKDNELDQKTIKPSFRKDDYGFRLCLVYKG